MRSLFFGSAVLLFPFSASRAELVQGSTERDAKKPAPHRTLPSKASGLAVGGEKGLLRHVFRKRMVTQNSVCHVAHFGFIAANKLFECPFITFNVPGQRVSVRIHGRPSISRRRLKLCLTRQPRDVGQPGFISRTQKKVHGRRG